MNVEKVTPKSLESEKAAEYALAVCEEGIEFLLAKIAVVEKAIKAGVGVMVALHYFAHNVVFKKMAAHRANLQLLRAQPAGKIGCQTRVHEKEFRGFHQTPRSDIGAGFKK